jgi:predicted O-linked N-acetylglucosamine transferase (SPINDLY family)
MRPPAVATGLGAQLMMKLKEASGLHQQGMLAEAERLYRDVLAQAPAQPDALHFLGVLETQRGRHEAGLTLMDRALKVSPGNAAILYNRANTLREMGRLEDALAGYDAALKIRKDNIAALNNRGTVLQSLHRYQKAIDNFDAVLRLNPHHADALVNRGNALVELKRGAEALENYDRALVIAPSAVAALYGKGNALANLNRLEEAVSFYERALALEPNNPQLLNNCGNALCKLSRYGEAIAAFDRAIAAAPRDADPFSNRGNALMLLRRFEEALASYERALVLHPDHGETLYGRASALVELKRHDEAIAAFQELLRKQPDYPYALGMLVYAQRTCCDWRDNAAASEMIEAIRAGKRVATPLVLLAVSDSDGDKLRCAEILMRDKYPPRLDAAPRRPAQRHDRIRVAYLSADFRQHPVPVLMAGVFEHHDRVRFETIALSHGLNDASEMRSRLERSFDRFIDVQGKSDRELAALTVDLDIDILVDLTGLTAHARQGLLSLRPAPVQVNYLGYAGSFGGAHVDYIVADRTVIPEEQKQFYAEQVVYLPDCFMPHDSTRRIAETVPSRTAAGLPARGFVFASFNNAYKFNAPVFAISMRLLDAIPDSVLWLPMANAAATRNLRREAQERGINPDRIVFAPHLPRAEDHLARLKLADLFLDTFPYNAHTTASDALWAGVPLLTRQGKSFASRVAASLLLAVGLPDLITHDAEAYERKALELARDPAALGALRATLAANRDSCALFDTARFTRNLEAAYLQMWERAQTGVPPASFAVRSAASAPT